MRWFNSLLALGSHPSRQWIIFCLGVLERTLGLKMEQNLIFSILQCIVRQWARQQRNRCSSLAVQTLLIRFLKSKYCPCCNEITVLVILRYGGKNWGLLFKMSILIIFSIISKQVFLINLNYIKDFLFWAKYLQVSSVCRLLNFRT